jgi:hypothetical protein
LLRTEQKETNDIANRTLHNHKILVIKFM